MLGGHGAHPRGRELYGKRHTLELAAHLRDGTCVLGGERENRQLQAGALDEEPYRPELGQLLGQ